MRKGEYFPGISVAMTNNGIKRRNKNCPAVDISMEVRLLPDCPDGYVSESLTSKAFQAANEAVLHVADTLSDSERTD